MLQTRVGNVSISPPYSHNTSLCPLPRTVFSSSAIPVLLWRFLIAFIFPSASCGTSSPSPHFFIFPFTGGRSDFFHSFWIFFWGLIIGLLLVLFEPIFLFLFSRMWKVLLCICMVGLLQGHDLNDISSRRSSVHTQIWYRVLIFHFMCTFHILGANKSPCKYT